MGTPHYIKKHLKQTLLYWGNPTSDGRGKNTFDTAVELKGRVESQSEVVRTNLGKEVVSRAIVWLDQEVDEGGYLALGTLDDSALDSDPDDPYAVNGSSEILVMTKNVRLGSTTQFEYIAHMNMGLWA